MLYNMEPPIDLQISVFLHPKSSLPSTKSEYLVKVNFVIIFTEIMIKIPLHVQNQFVFIVRNKYTHQGYRKNAL